MKIIRINEVPVEEREGYSIKRLCTEELLKNPENMDFMKLQFLKVQLVRVMLMRT